MTTMHDATMGTKFSWDMLLGDGIFDSTGVDVGLISASKIQIHTQDTENTISTLQCILKHMQ